MKQTKVCYVTYATLQIYNTPESLPAPLTPWLRPVERPFPPLKRNVIYGRPLISGVFTEDNAVLLENISASCVMIQCVVQVFNLAIGTYLPRVPRPQSADAAPVRHCPWKMYRLRRQLAMYCGTVYQ